MAAVAPWVAGLAAAGFVRITGRKKLNDVLDDLAITDDERIAALDDLDFVTEEKDRVVEQLRELTEELEKKTTLIRSEKKEKEDLKAALAAETAEKELLKTTVATLQSEKDKLLAEAGQKEKDLVNQMAANGDTMATKLKAANEQIERLKIELSDAEAQKKIATNALQTTLQANEAKDHAEKEKVKAAEREALEKKAAEKKRLEAEEEEKRKKAEEEKKKAEEESHKDPAARKAEMQSKVQTEVITIRNRLQTEALPQHERDALVQRLQQLMQVLQTIMSMPAAASPTLPAAAMAPGGMQPQMAMQNASPPALGIQQNLMGSGGMSMQPNNAMQQGYNNGYNGNYNNANYNNANYNNGYNNSSPMDPRMSIGSRPQAMDPRTSLGSFNGMPMDPRVQAAVQQQNNRISGEFTMVDANAGQAAANSRVSIGSAHSDHQKDLEREKEKERAFQQMAAKPKSRRMSVSGLVPKVGAARPAADQPAPPAAAAPARGQRNSMDKGNRNSMDKGRRNSMDKGNRNSMDKGKKFGRVVKAGTWGDEFAKESKAPSGKCPCCKVEEVDGADGMCKLCRLGR
mmetsp:Transcript_6411/g.12168  ORF Transcript_6411/g.12168 Transcript_6411/m.12168 type:complete len:573 (+) Transcript_6411:70-1788(+)